jgi:hypothetical protein
MRVICYPRRGQSYGPGRGLTRLAGEGDHAPTAEIRAAVQAAIVT